MRGDDDQPIDVNAFVQALSASGRVEDVTKPPRSREERRQRVIRAMDRRRLPKTGRTASYSFRLRPETLARLREFGADKPLGFMAEWMENLVEQALAREGRKP